MQARETHRRNERLQGLSYAQITQNQQEIQWKEREGNQRCRSQEEVSAHLASTAINPICFLREYRMVSAYLFVQSSC